MNPKFYEESMIREIIDFYYKLTLLLGDKLNLPETKKLKDNASEVIQKIITPQKKDLSQTEHGKLSELITKLSS